MTLKDFFDLHPKCAIGFSGGVDSVFLLYSAFKYGADVKPYFVKSAFQTEKECEEASEIAKKFGFDLKILEVDVLADINIRKNDAMRCYFCKKELFTNIIKAAQLDGYDVILEGTNLSDDIEDRPGYWAIKELGVLSPLRECQITKDMIRSGLKDAGVNIWNKPSSACLATRVPCGTEITEQNLFKAKSAEEVLRNLGFTDFRVRILGQTAKIQLNEKDFVLLHDLRHEIVDGLSGWFEDILLDLKER